jgi:hypothetical protein
MTGLIEERKTSFKLLTPGIKEVRKTSFKDLVVNIPTNLKILKSSGMILSPIQKIQKMSDAVLTPVPMIA